MSAVSFDKVSIRLAQRPILADVSFAIEPGEFVGVLGPNGAGKTTLMRAILGLLPTDDGRIDVLGASPRCGNAAIGYVPQFRRTAGQLGITGNELLLSALRGDRWGLPVRSPKQRENVSEALSRVGAADLARRVVSELSGGERQRLFIAQALIGSPKLLLLDEPLMSLDPARQRSIVQLVRTVSRQLNVALLFSAHEINPLLGMVDRVLYLGNGHAAIGTIDDVINDDCLSALYGARVHVVRAEGRIFVTAEDGMVDGHEHDHENA